ncbi:MAG: hypothetical protein NC429_05125 [Lachnospiraceae bacterium]|nr:hypothetical protein [Lachnospiraceae bacterium]
MREIPQGKVIYSVGQKLDSFYLIRKGTVTVTYQGGRYLLQSGDVIGLCEIGSGVSGMEYRAGAGVEVLVYPYGAAQMKHLFESSRDAVRFFTSSFFRQLNEILGRYRVLREESMELYEYLNNSYNTYLSLCEKYHIPPETLAGYGELSQPSAREEVPMWINGYYSTLEQMIAIWDYNKTDYDFVYGFMLKSSSDIRTILTLSQKLHRYQTDACKYLMNEDGLDLVELMFHLYEEIMYSGGGSEDILIVRGSMDGMIQQLYRHGYDVQERKARIVEGISAVEEDAKSPAPKRRQRQEKQTAEASGQGAGQTAEATGQSAGQTAGATGQSAGQTAEASSQSAGQTAGATGQSAEQTAEASGQSAGQTAEASGQSAGQTEEASGQSAEQTEEASGQSAEQTAEASGQSAEQTAEASGQSTEQAETSASKFEPIPEEALNEDLPAELENSIETILNFAGCEKELADSFKSHIGRYRKMPNKNGTEDDIRVLRQEITKEFNQIYCSAFLNSIDKELPTAVKMFFTFGYVDEKLAGEKNAVFLYHLIKRLPTNPEQGVYSVYEWLQAVYEEKKEPCRNEFDTDYVAYLLEQKRMGNITAEEQKELLTDKVAKVRFELENMFPVVNKVTYGRLSTFCPVFSGHNIMKPMDSMLVSTDKIMEVLEEIRGKDYGAYYRETMYTNPQQGIPKEVIHVEILPDFILMPNAGIRGVMWQEIEGKKRTTPARMMVSIFQMEDLKAILIRLTGEFRWEMCKRVQGARWNDLSEKSLTSEYFDYIQFYRKNSDLSTETKEKIKTDLGRTKNSFKEMFLRDYSLWIMYESNSSPRLNKVARAIFFTYCTFTTPVRQKLRANPLYQELADRYEIKQKQKRHKYENICQKLRSQGKEIPEEIQNEMDFMNM